MLCTWRAFFACGFRKRLARNELNEDDSHGSEDNCAEVKRKQTNGRNHDEEYDDDDLSDAELDNAKHRRAKTSRI